MVAGGIPLDVLWDACGEQSTGCFHRLMPREQGDAGLTGGLTAMRVQRPDGGSDTVSVHAAGGLAKVGDVRRSRGLNYNGCSVVRWFPLARAQRIHSRIAKKKKKVGDALSAFFDGNGGGLFAPSAVSAEDQDLLLAAVDSGLCRLRRWRGAGDQLGTGWSRWSAWQRP